MEKYKNQIVIGIIAFVIISGAYLMFSKKSEPVVVNNNTKPQALQVPGVNLYYSNSCPHCKVVEDFIEANGLRTQVAFAEKEISSNQNYSQEMQSLAAECGIPTSELGVPFLWDGSKCYIGDKDIIAFFKEKANIK